MRFPKEIDVFGMKVAVVLDHPVKDEKGDKCHGHFDGETNVITIDSKDSEEERLHTLIHELGHAIWKRTSLGQTDIPSNLEEIVVNNFATAMLETFDLTFKRKKR